MDYVCEDMKEMVIYEQNTISITLEQHHGNTGRIDPKSEVPMDAYEILSATSKIPKDKGSEKGAVIIEGARGK